MLSWVAAASCPYLYALPQDLPQADCPELRSRAVT